MTCRSRPRPAPAIAWVVLCGMLVVLGARVVASLYQDPSDPFVDAGTIPTRSVHPKIDVNGNAQLAMIVDRGSGTESDPYIIENRIINAGGIDSAIYIRHTTAHLVIKNCTLSNAGDGIDIGPAGLFLQNVQNVRITGCRVHNNQQAGILIYVSQDVTVEASNVTGNMFGVQVTRSNHTLVTKCTVTSNSYGILPQGSRHTTITWNTVSGNYYGALLVQSNNSHVVRNQFNNTINAGDYHGYDNTWNDGARGNYWADYEILYRYVKL